MRRGSHVVHPCRGYSDAQREYIVICKGICCRRPGCIGACCRYFASSVTKVHELIVVCNDCCTPRSGCAGGFCGAQRSVCVEASCGRLSSSPKMTDALIYFVSLTGDRCREVRGIDPGEGQRGKRSIFLLLVSDVPTMLTVFTDRRGSSRDWRVLTSWTMFNVVSDEH